MIEEHVITIPKNGKVKIEVTGVKGQKCLEATRAIEAKFGRTTNRTETPEMYEQTQDVQLKNFS